MLEFRVSNDVLDDPPALQSRAAEEGYLFFKGLIDLDLLHSLRQQILTLCAEAGWLSPDADPYAGITAPGVSHIEGQRGFMQVYNKVMKLEDFHAFAHQPGLIAMYDVLFGETTLVHARNIARMIFPQATEHTTPAHQDYLYIEGTEDTWTSWIPLGDCPQELGSLAVLPGSHRQGMYPVYRSLGAGGHRIDTDGLPFEWTASNFAEGDVITFHSLLVHRGLPNQTIDRMRLSVDYRYQGWSKPIVQGSLEPHYGQLKWPEIYDGWQSDAYQYYWERHPINLVNNRAELRERLLVQG